MLSWHLFPVSWSTRLLPLPAGCMAACSVSRCSALLLLTASPPPLCAATLTAVLVRELRNEVSRLLAAKVGVRSTELGWLKLMLPARFWAPCGPALLLLLTVLLWTLFEPCGSDQCAAEWQTPAWVGTSGLFLHRCLL